MRRILMIALVLVAAALLACPATAGRVKHPSELKFPELTMEPLAYEELTFENGMTGFFVEDHEVPVVNIYMLIPVSAPPKEKTGLAGLTSWAVRNGGSENWPAERINEELEFVSASVEFGGGGGGMFSRGGGVSSSRADVEPTPSTTSLKLTPTSSKRIPSARIMPRPLPTVMWDVP